MSSPPPPATVRAAVAVGSALLAVGAVLGDVGPPGQPVLVLWFVLVCPGLAFVGLARPSSVLFGLALSVAISCALAVLVAQTLLYAGAWNPLGGLLVLAAITVVGCVTELVVEARVRHPAVTARREAA